MVLSTANLANTQRIKAKTTRTYQFVLIGHSINTKNMFFIFTLYVLCFQMAEAQSCVTLTASQSNKVCEICSKNQVKSCKQTLENGIVQKLTQSQCRQTCCNSSIYKDSINQKFCNYQKPKQEQDINPVTLVLVIVLSIPTLILLFCILVRCLRAEKIDEVEDCPITNEALQKMNKDQLGPQLQDRKIVCSICLEDGCNIRTVCGHSYHSQCFLSWIKQKKSCPLCQTNKPEPIIVYCTRCYQSQSLALLPQQNDDQMKQIKEWRRYSSVQCHSCRYRQMGAVDLEDLEISFSDSKTTRKQRTPTLPQSTTKIRPQN